MADILQVYDVSCPANTPQTAPVTALAVGSGLYYVSKVRLVIPAGHAGLTGIALAFGGQNVIPLNANAWISGDDEIFDYDLGDYPPGVPWSVSMCNSDYVSHAWETRWHLEIVNLNTGQSTATPVSVQDIYAADNLQSVPVANATS